MSFIQPPTDSLYKFQALSGIALIVFALSVPVKFSHEVQLRRFEVKRHTGMTKPEYEFWEGRHRLLGQAYEKHQADLRTLQEMATQVPVEQRTQEQNQLLHEFGRSLDAEKQRNIQLSNSNLEQGKTTDQHLNIMKVNDEELSYLMTAAIALGAIGVGSFAVGLWLAVRGFRAWYDMAQKYQDMILVREATHRGDGTHSHTKKSSGKRR